MTRSHIIEQIRSAMPKFNPHCTTILYGSEARGEANDYSDIDLLILVDGDKLSVADELKITQPLYDEELRPGYVSVPW